MQKRWPGLAEALGLVPSFLEIAEVDWDKGDVESFSIVATNRIAAHSAAEREVRPRILRTLKWPSL